MMDPAVSTPPVKEHRRTRSAVLKSMLPAGKSLMKNHAASSGDKNSIPAPMSPTNSSMPFLPMDHPHANQRVLGEIPPNSGKSQPRRAATSEDQPPSKYLHKRTKSAVSLRSLGKSKDEKAKDASTPKSSTRRKAKEGEPSPDKKKSTTSLASMFKGKPSKDNNGHDQDGYHSDKENSTPPRKHAQPVANTPIYAAFASQQQEVTSTTKVPLNDHDRRRSLIEQIALYDPDPKRFDESKQRNFYGYDAKQNKAIRPTSEVISNHELGRFLENPLTRKSSGERRQQSRVDGDGSGRKNKAVQEKVRTADQLAAQKRSEATSNSSRVKDAVARINRRTVKARDDSAVDPQKFSEDFDAMLEARNIPDLVRQQMRVLDQHVKQALLRSYEQDLEAARGHSSGSDRSFHVDQASAISLPLTQAGVAEETTSRDSSLSKKEEVVKSDEKKARPRSRTFTFKKSDKSSSSTSPAKKQKTEMSIEMKRSSQPDLISPTLMSTSPATPSGSYFMGLAKKNVPEDYVKYLQKHRNPADVEVGKLHKLRQLLRNETVSWVHRFIELGGMTELVDLLHRLMDIEWREERDDQLLNEALLCLKGLCTTDLALQKLCEIEKTLFPALLAMLFDKEHKGPSEFTTRQIVFNILLAHLEAAVRFPDVLPIRAKTILSYLADQTHPDKRNPLPFDVEVGPKRPYKIWNREVSNVTKEVFWVWLHPLNLIPYPHVDVQVESTGCMNPDQHQHPTVRKCPPARDISTRSYTHEFFPRPRPPVPAAPYIGGVEWDATNYLASHIDLLNGLLAALPTRAERNELRAELRSSGFERTMGEKLRQCKEKYYGAVHDVLRTWVAAAVCDGWDVREVRMGPPKEETQSPRKATSPRKSPAKKAQEQPPKIEAPPKLNLDLGLGKEKSVSAVGGDGKLIAGVAVVDAWL